jgi:two-component system cell cycle sensor histidine kinase/response regulator CckA
MFDSGFTSRTIPPAGRVSTRSLMDEKSGSNVAVHSRQQQRTILLADDVEMIRNSCRRMLERFGYQVITAVDGMQALEIYKTKSRTIDLVILDMIMPNLDGRKTLHELKKIDPSVKALIFSGELPPDELRRTLDDGFMGCISKPFDIAVMLDTLKKVLN